ncbi:hypothetical protein N0B40_07530 [Chryseobacterium oranimense]|uniref:hypothetical protein n=1 Tax=Chryseobacterium oranimense TaxID=421058 RepID=UPI0021B03926|nr:hypothetical protein [Chryseobacterium oranimense]UWX62134.1 hypothetical protein N0B40_07530 [Chryseobacterium oranimense]
MFSNIYKQRHLFTFYIISSGLLRIRARTVVKVCRDLLPGFAGNEASNGYIPFYIIKKKLTTITADTGKEIPVEKMNDHISLSNHPKFENPDFKRKNPGAGYPSFHIKFRQNRPEKTIAETTLIKTYLYE